MDWARDNLGLNEDDLANVFKYAPRESTVIQMLRSKQYELEISSVHSEEEWSHWLGKEVPPIDGSESGLVLLLAKRTGDPPIPSISKVSSDEWARFVRGQVPPEKGAWMTRAKTFSALGGKKILEESAPATATAAGDEKGIVSAVGIAAATVGGGRRSVRTLPFSAENFRRITNCFHTHGSIARVVSRTDVPTFSAEQVEMSEKPAYVYNCRSSNAWGLDLALSLTYFPGCGLTFAILYGCYFSAAEAVVRRLSRVAGGPEAAHPLLVPGVFAELERVRHRELVQSTIATVETKIFELDVLQQSEGLGGPRGEEAERRNIAKRNVWLDTTYLRNGLVSWNIQLGKMAQHAEELAEEVSSPVSSPRLARRHHEADGMSSGSRSPGMDTTILEEPQDPGLDRRGRGGADVGTKIRGRINAIRDEYEDWTRDCTMRVDGMAMATQWAQGETTVEIALATKRDSKHMRSIAMLTMVFLPGTFLASVFSMTFFNWFSDDGGGASVSSYIWIYVLITVAITLLTVGLWYFFVIYRPSRSQKWDDDDEE